MPNLTAKLVCHIVGYRGAELDRAALTRSEFCIGMVQGRRVA
jgi:hypothetical protein